MIILRWKKGYTLLELLAVVTIIGIVSALSLPQLANVTERSRSREAVQQLVDWYGAEQRWSVDNGGAFTRVVGNLDITLRAPTNFGALTFFPAVGNLTALTMTRNAPLTYQIRIELGGANQGIIRCSDLVGGVRTFGGGLCPRIGFADAAAATPGLILQ